MTLSSSGHLATLLLLLHILSSFGSCDLLASQFSCPLLICFCHCVLFPFPPTAGNSQGSIPRPPVFFPLSRIGHPPRFLGQSSLRFQLLNNLTSRSPASSRVPSLKEPLWACHLDFCLTCPEARLLIFWPKTGFLIPHQLSHFSFIWDTVNIPVPALKYYCDLRVIFFIPHIQPITNPSRFLHWSASLHIPFLPPPHYTNLIFSSHQFPVSTFSSRHTSHPALLQI